MKAALSDMLAQIMTELLSEPSGSFTPAARRKLGDLRKLLQIAPNLDSARFSTDEHVHEETTNATFH